MTARSGSWEVGRLRSLLWRSRSVSTLSAQNAPDRSKPPALGASAATEAASDSEADALQRPACVGDRGTRGAARSGQPAAEVGQQRRSRRQIRSGEPDCRHARRRRGLTLGARNRRRDRFPRRRSRHEQLVRRLRRTAGRAGCAPGSGAERDGRCRAQADVSRRRARTRAPGTAHRSAAGARRSGNRCADGVRAAAVRTNASVRHRRSRHGGHAQGASPLPI